MLKKIHLFHRIKKFYNIFGAELDSNFIHKLSDITNNNLHDVLFDINEVLEANSQCFYEEAYELDVWLNKLKTQITNFRESATLKTCNNKFDIRNMDNWTYFTGIYIYKQGSKYYVCNKQQSDFIDMDDVAFVGNKKYIQQQLNCFQEQNA